jgi:hypothetical protein
VVYITRDKQIKMINLIDILNASESDIKPIIFFEKLLHDKIVIDEDSYDTAVLWTKDKKAADYLRHQLVLRRRYPNKTEEITLEVPEFCIPNTFLPDEKYEYASKNGYFKYGKHHLCKVALRGNIIVALSSDGKLLSWEVAINDKNKDNQKNIVHEDQHKIESTQSDGIVVKSRSKRGSLRGMKVRSKSDEEKINKRSAWDKLVSRTEDHGDLKQASSKQIESKMTKQTSPQTSPQNTANKDFMEEKYGSTPRLPKKTTNYVLEENKRYSSPPLLLQQFTKDAPEDKGNKKNIGEQVDSVTKVEEYEESKQIFSKQVEAKMPPTLSSPLSLQRKYTQTTEESKRYSLPPTSSQIVPQSTSLKDAAVKRPSSSPDIPRRKSDQSNTEEKKRIESEQKK